MGITERRIAFSAAIIVAGLALHVSDLSAQPVRPPTRVWMGLGLGGGAVRDLEAGGAATFQITAQWGSHHTVFRALIMGDPNFQSGSGDGIEEVGILYGRRAASSFGYVGLAAGLAAVSVDGFTGVSRETRRTTGLPVVAEAALQSTIVGLGIQAFGNLNTVSMYGGVSLFLHLGWMP